MERPDRQKEQKFRLIVIMVLLLFVAGVGLFAFYNHRGVVEPGREQIMRIDVPPQGTASTPAPASLPSK